VNLLVGTSILEEHLLLYVNYPLLNNLTSSLKVEAERSSIMLVSTYKSQWRYNPEDQNLILTAVKT